MTVAPWQPVLVMSQCSTIGHVQVAEPLSAGRSEIVCASQRRGRRHHGDDPRAIVRAKSAAVQAGATSTSATVGVAIVATSVLYD